MHNPDGGKVVETWEGDARGAGRGQVQGGWGVEL